MAMRKLLLLILLLLILLLIVGGLTACKANLQSTKVDGKRAYRDVLAQVEFGARIPDSKAHTQTVAYIQEELRKNGWKVEIQKTSWKGFPIENIISSRNNDEPDIIIGAHYDTRLLADQDRQPGVNTHVPGANDGASGVAVLLELARTIPIGSNQPWLVFFDSEDNGGLEGRDWIMGSRAFVSALSFQPRAAVIVDMVGDCNLDIYKERNSNEKLQTDIWKRAAALGYQAQFIQKLKYSMLDDHTPFLEAGIPAVDIIDFDYPYWHTSSDTIEKVCPQSLEIVTETLLSWISLQR
jgi:glutaminyl-peptide cyclotransferase